MHRNIKSHSGQAIVEFALVLPIMLAFLLGIMEFGVLFYNKAMVTNASREGARAGMIFHADQNNHYVPVSDTTIQNAVSNYLDGKIINFSGTPAISTEILRQGTSPRYDSSGGSVEVRVSYTHTYMALPKFIGLGDTIAVGAKTTMRLE